MNRHMNSCVYTSEPPTVPALAERQAPKIIRQLVATKLHFRPIRSPKNPKKTWPRTLPIFAPLAMSILLDSV